MKTVAILVLLFDCQNSPAGSLFEIKHNESRLELMILGGFRIFSRQRITKKSNRQVTYSVTWSFLR